MRNTPLGKVEKAYFLAPTGRTIPQEELKFDTILPMERFDLYFLADGSKVLENVTKTPHNERYPFVTTNGDVVCLSDVSGINNTYVVDSESKKLVCISNLNRNVIRHHAVSESDAYVTMYYEDGSYRVFNESLITAEVKPYLTHTGKAKNVQPEPIIIETKVPEKVVNVKPEYGFLFQSEFPDPDIVGAYKIYHIPTGRKFIRFQHQYFKRNGI